MSIEIVQGTSQKPASSRELVRILSGCSELSGQLFVGYPIIGTSTGPHLIDALLISEELGIVLFDLIEGNELGNFQWRQDDSANKLEARLKTHSELMDRRNLRIQIHTISFAPSIVNLGQDDEDTPIVNQRTVIEEIKKCRWPESDTSVYRSALSAIESVSAIRKTRTRRTTQQEDSRGAKLNRLENSIATLDHSQSRAVIETVDGVQRIRGLAGSGKTIVLALKAAYLHAQHPDWRIAVTFNTRSLKGQFRRLINNFSLEQASEEPDWEHLRILNAWGAPGGTDRDGIYHEFCRENELEYFDFQGARSRFGPNDTFSKACQNALSDNISSKELYDVILVDEAQDFSAAFLRLCYRMLRPPKRLVYAYDELQTLSGESLPSIEEIFGSDREVGDLHDIILDRCYRNSRPVLVTAHGLGFGIYRRPRNRDTAGLIQMFDNSRLWTEVGYRVENGALEDGQPVTLYRTDDTSPKFLEDHSAVDDLIQFKVFNNATEQAKWLAESICRNIKEDELSANDIVVINPDPLKTRRAVGIVRRELLNLGIKSHLAGVDTDPDTFFRNDEQSVTFTGIYRAKGNEAGMVYVMNSQDCNTSTLNLARIRNQLFTAITRSKSWVRVVGVGSRMRELETEYERIKKRGYKLEFTYPDANLREQLRIVHRDMSEAERKRLEDGQLQFRELADQVQSGGIFLEDLDPEVVETLREFLT